jgi:short-subunit dehydrogenase
MTKHAVVGLSLSLRGEAAAYGVRVTAVCPGVVETPILDKGGPDDLPKSPAAGHTREFFRHVQSRFYPADRMAQDIVRGIDRNAALVVAPASARLAWYIWRYTPLVANQMTARHVAWARATFGAHSTEAGTGGAAVEARVASRRVV